MNRFCWQVDCVAVNEALQIVFILKFERSTDSDKDKRFPEVKESETNDHESIIGALKTDFLIHSPKTPRAYERQGRLLEGEVMIAYQQVVLSTQEVATFKTSPSLP
jgi:hypothetical protein